MSTSIIQNIRTNFLWNYLRHCHVCGSTFPPIQWLCKPCSHILRQNFLNSSQMLRLQSHFRHCRLIDWNSENDIFIRRVIKSLKGNYPSPLFYFLAQEFLLRIKEVSSIVRDEPFCFIPCPSKTNHVDHGFFFSQSLESLTKFPMNPVLKTPKKTKEQKGKNLLFRKQKQFENISINPLPEGHRIVFIDDILTTGSTAYAAYTALGKPKPFMVWSLFWRQLL